MDLDKLMKLDLSYPGISFGYHSWSLGVYIESLEDFISHAGDQYRLRAQMELDRRVDKLPAELYTQELAYIDEAADEHIPAYARMAAIVLVWGMFESTAIDISRYLARKESVSLKLNDIRANGFIVRVSKYFSDVLHIELPWTESEMASARNLKLIRDAIAHRNGNFTDALTEHKTRIQHVVEQLLGVSLRGNQLIVSGEYVGSSAELVYTMISSLNALVSTRYDGPTV